MPDLNFMCYDMGTSSRNVKHLTLDFEKVQSALRMQRQSSVQLRVAGYGCCT